MAIETVTKRRAKLGTRRRGAAMLEFAIVLPLFLLLLLGIIEMGRVIMLHQVATNAAREGARRAVVPGATQATVTAAVNEYLNNAGISATGRSVKVYNSAGTSVLLETIPPREPATVEITFPYASNTWGFSRIVGNGSLRNQVTMRRE